jgi:hypothetical protein
MVLEPRGSLVIVAVDEATALVVEPREWQVLGNS